MASPLKNIAAAQSALDYKAQRAAVWKRKKVKLSGANAKAVKPAAPKKQSKSTKGTGKAKRKA